MRIRSADLARPFRCCRPRRASRASWAPTAPTSTSWSSRTRRLTDAQLVLQALRVQDAINLDGGGTAAMWIEGQYTVGPGRLLPNAILLIKP